METSSHSYCAIQTPTKGNETLSQQSSSSTLTLKRLLQKNIKILILALPSLEAAEKDGKKHIASLANLLEQRECVERVEESNIDLISSFPDLKSRLLLKVSTESEKEIDNLKSLLIPLKELKQSLYQAHTQILSLASQHAKDIDLGAMYQGTAKIPPLANMMDLIQAIEKETRELYCSRMYYLEDVSDQSIITSENVRGLWMENATNIFNAIKDCQELAKYFLEENL